MNKKESSPAGRIIIGIIITGVVIGLAGYYLFLRRPGMASRNVRVSSWIHHPETHSEWAITAGERCTDAPFLLPTNGFIGYLWDDSFRIGTRHQGIDIFAGTDIGITPVYAAYDGYLTRQSDWVSTVIIRIPSDPLMPGRQIWMYYTHMADPDGNSFISDQFPPGTSEMFVTAGTLLGYQGNYSGSPDNPVGVHLHFSIIRDDGTGRYLNELQITNTIDPSPYFGLPLNGIENTGEIPVCPLNP